MKAMIIIKLINNDIIIGKKMKKKNLYTKSEQLQTYKLLFKFYGFVFGLEFIIKKALKEIYGERGWDGRRGNEK